MPQIPFQAWPEVVKVSVSGEPNLHTCLNCGSPDIGKFCPDCGQRNRAPVRSIGHFLAEAFEALTHVDSRLWRTIWGLIARPGFLTREYIIGRQVRYLPPVQLYLFLSLLLFLVARSVESDTPVMLDVRPAGTAQLSGAERAERICPQIDYGGPFASQIRPRLIAGCQKSAMDGGAALQDAFLRNVPRALFLLLPLLALVMQLLYWRPRHFYVEHLLLLIHNHSAAFVAITAVLVVGAIPGLAAVEGVLAAVVGLYLVWYLYRSLRRVYGQSRGWTLGKFGILCAIYLLVTIIVLATTALVSVATT